MQTTKNSRLTKGHIVICGSQWADLIDALTEYIPQDQLHLSSRQALFDQTEAVRSQTVALVPGIERVDGKLMKRLPNLQLIQQAGVGLEGVDLRSASQRNIYVANIPSAGTGNAESVAELAILHMMMLGRSMDQAAVNARHQAWNQPLGQSLWQKTVGIYGFGAIGRALARRLKPFGVNLIAIKRHQQPELVERYGLEWLGTPEDRSRLLEQSDYVVIAASANAGVDRPFSRSDFQCMKTPAYLINIARGLWVDEQALIEALEQGWIAGAGLDVFDHEPLDPDSSLLSKTGLNLILTPHIGGVTRVSYDHIAERIAVNLQRVLKGQTPHHVQNQPTPPAAGSKAKEMV